MTSDVGYRTLRAADDPALTDVKRIYEQAFPRTERKPTNCFDRMLERKDYAVIVAEAGGIVAGFAVVFIPASEKDAVLLEYLAVDSARRNAGVGHRLLEQTVEAAATRPVLVEVESADDEQATRRRSFYGRHGFVKISGLRYLPPLPGAPPMELMVAGHAVPVPRIELVRWLEIVYGSVYELPNSDQRLQEMLRGLAL